MKLLRIVSFMLLFVAVGFGLGRIDFSQTALVSPTLPEPTIKPLLKYTHSNLETYIPNPSQIQLTKEMVVEEGLIAYEAVYQTGGKRMSMQLMVPQTATPSGGFPVVLLIRGFVDPEIYQTGVGTKNAARYFASSGYATVAPDFLGFGTSDESPTDTIEARVERPKQLLDLIASLATLPIIDANQLQLWGHSNGGQIAISLLEMSGKPYPTVLWAPVTKPFPYSILYFADESEDGGKALRKVVANFEKDYDVFDFSIDKHLSRITAPIEIHQGTSDDAVPVAWSDTFVEQLKSLEKDVTYYTYPGADHNLRPAWNTAVARSLSFYNKQLE